MSLKDKSAATPFAPPLVWMPGVSIGRLGIADMVNRKERVAQQDLSHDTYPMLKVYLEATLSDVGSIQ